MPTFIRYIRRFLRWFIDVTIMNPLRSLGRRIDRIVRQCMPYVWGFGALYILYTTGALGPVVDEVGSHLHAIVMPIIAMCILWYGYKFAFRKAFGGSGGGKKKKKR